VEDTPERLQAARRFSLKSLLLSLFVLSSVFSVVVRPHHTQADTPPLLQMPVDGRIAQLTAYMDKAKFAPDQYQYIPQFITDADNNSIPPTLLVCIEVAESSGGKRYIRDTHNPFGWASDRVSFSSESAAIDFISNQLGSGRYYKGKSITGKLTAYNSAAYAVRVQNCMSQIK